MIPSCLTKTLLVKRPRNLVDVRRRNTTRLIVNNKLLLLVHGKKPIPSNIKKTKKPVESAIQKLAPKNGRDTWKNMEMKKGVAEEKVTLSIQAKTANMLRLTRRKLESA